MSSAYVTSGLRLSGRYTSARNVVISKVSPSFSQPMVPNRWPWVHTSSAHGRDQLDDRLGTGIGRDVDVGPIATVEERVAHAAADEEGPVSGRAQPAGQCVGR